MRIALLLLLIAIYGISIFTGGREDEQLVFAELSSSYGVQAGASLEVSLEVVQSEISVEYELTGNPLPEGVVLDGTARTLSWAPEAHQAGAHTFNLTVSTSERGYSPGAVEFTVVVSSLISWTQPPPSHVYSDINTAVSSSLKAEAAHHQVGYRVDHRGCGSDLQVRVADLSGSVVLRSSQELECVLEVQALALEKYQSTGPVDILSNQTAQSVIEVSDHQAAENPEPQWIEVDLDIEHSFPSDLVVSLIAPSGQEVTLFNETVEFNDGEASSIVGTFPGGFPEYLVKDVDFGIFGESTVAGAWVLKVEDLYEGDEGVVNSWAIRFGAAGGSVQTVSKQVHYRSKDTVPAHWDLESLLGNRHWVLKELDGPAPASSGQLHTTHVHSESCLPQGEANKQVFRKLSQSSHEPRSQDSQDHSDPTLIRSQVQLEAVVESVMVHYRDLLMQFRDGVKISYFWDSPIDFIHISTLVNDAGEAEFNFYGSLPKVDGMTRDGMALMTCHEIGHHLAGYPFAPGYPWARSSEGQSDYFATQSCLRTAWQHEATVNSEYTRRLHEDLKATPALKVEAKVIKAHCEEAFPHASGKQSLCHRIAYASLSVSRVFHLLAGGDENERPSFTTPDTNQRSGLTETDDLAPQCQLDNFHSGSLCSVVFDDSIIPGLALNADLHQSGINDFASQVAAFDYSCTKSSDSQLPNFRSRCWFNPLEGDDPELVANGELYAAIGEKVWEQDQGFRLHLAAPHDVSFMVLCWGDPEACRSNTTHLQVNLRQVEDRGGSIRLFRSPALPIGVVSLNQTFTLISARDDGARESFRTVIIQAYEGDGTN